MTRGVVLSKLGHEIMTAGGWTRLWCANAPRPLPKEMRGLSDNGYIRDGVLLFVEDKGDGDKISEAQETFKRLLDEDAPQNVHYLIAECVEDYENYVNIRWGPDKL